MNLFRCTPDKSLDREYLRTCAVYKLLKTGRVNKQRAIDLLICHPKIRKGVVEMWLNGPLKHIKEAAQ